MKRIIVDYKKLTPEVLGLLVEKFPDGYGIRDVVHFTNHKGKYIEAVEVNTDDTVFMVIVSDQLVDSMDNHEEEDAIRTDSIEEIKLDESDLIDDDK